MQEKVVYVDDEPNSLTAVRRLFIDAPFEFITYTSPMMALAEMKAIYPSVVISDQRMPEMNGIEFLEKVKNDQPETVCIILTGYADLESTMDAINKGHVYGYIEKPWNDSELKNLVQSALNYRTSLFELSSLPDILTDEMLRDPRGRRAIRKMAEAICHQLSQPVMIISGYVHLLQNFVKGDDLSMLYLTNIMLKIDALNELRNKVDRLSKRIGRAH